MRQGYVTVKSRKNVDAPCLGLRPVATCTPRCSGPFQLDTSTITPQVWKSARVLSWSRRALFLICCHFSRDIGPPRLRFPLVMFTMQQSRIRSIDTGIPLRHCKGNQLIVGKYGFRVLRRTCSALEQLHSHLGAINTNAFCVAHVNLP